MTVYGILVFIYLSGTLLLNTVEYMNHGDGVTAAKAIAAGMAAVYVASSM